MDDNLTDQQQAEVVKQWLKDNGLSILVSIGLGISAFFWIAVLSTESIARI